MVPGRRTVSFLVFASLVAALLFAFLPSASPFQSIGGRPSSLSRRVTRDHLGSPVPVHIGQYDDAEVVIGKERRRRNKTVNRSAVVHAAMAAIIVDPPAECIPGRGNLLALAGHACRHVGCVDIGEHAGAQDLFPVDLSLVSLDDEPARHVFDVRVDRPRGTNGGNVAERDRHDLFVALVVRPGEIGCLLRVDYREVAGGHPQRLEDAARTASSHDWPVNRSTR